MLQGRPFAIPDQLRRLWKAILAGTFGVWSIRRHDSPSECAIDGGHANERSGLGV